MFSFELQSRYNVLISLRLQHPLDCRPRRGVGHLNLVLVGWGI